MNRRTVHLLGLALGLGLAAQVHAQAGSGAYPNKPIKAVVPFAAGSATEGPALELTATDTDLQWQVAGAGEPVQVAGTLAALTSYLSGRGAAAVDAAGGAPDLPAWL